MNKEIKSDYIIGWDPLSDPVAANDNQNLIEWVYNFWPGHFDSNVLESLLNGVKEVLPNEGLMLF